MAFLSPVVNKDFNIYSKTYYDKQQHKKSSMRQTTTGSTTSPTATQTTSTTTTSAALSSSPSTLAASKKARVATSEEILAEKKRRMEILREKKIRKYPSARRKTPVALRKISEINEELDEELLFNELEKGFTQMRRLTEEDEEESINPEIVTHGKEKMNKSSAEVSSQPKRSSKGFSVLRWVRHSFAHKTTGTAGVVV